jgi:hypothetical protein
MLGDGVTPPKLQSGRGGGGGGWSGGYPVLHIYL